MKTISKNNEKPSKNIVINRLFHKPTNIVDNHGNLYLNVRSASKSIITQNKRKNVAKKKRKTVSLTRRLYVIIII